VIVNGVEHYFDALAIDELITRLGIEPRGIAVARNGEIVRRSEWSTTVLLQSDRIEIVTAAAGG
jgi:sulfur carrier protein